MLTRLRIALSRQDFRSGLQTLDCPVLVFAGDEDALHGSVAPAWTLLRDGHHSKLAPGRDTYVCERQVMTLLANINGVFYLNLREGVMNWIWKKTLGLGDKPALVVVDMIKGFTHAACPLGSDCPEVVAANATCCRYFISWTAGVSSLRSFSHEDQASVFRKRMTALNVLRPESRWVTVDERLEPQAARV